MPVLVVFALGSAISLLRILASNRDALSNLVWAEDGLFPLCIQVHGYFPCLVDPYEGYFLFLSRTLAFPVSLFPQSMWPLVSNLVAAVAFGFLSALITWLMLRAQFSLVFAMGAGLSAVLVPLVGLEAINTSGSAYMLLLVAAIIAVSFRFAPRLPLFMAPLILFISAITIPSSLVLFIPLLVFLFFDHENMRKQTLLNIAALGLGLVIQFSFIFSADNQRSVVVTSESIREWIEQYPNTFFSILPSTIDLDEIGQLTVSFYSPNIWVGLSTLGLISVLSVYLFSRKSSKLQGAGWLLLLGFLISLIPAISGYPINRYFVVPTITLVIALFIVVDTLCKERLVKVTTIVIALAFIAWIPNFGASNVRSYASPHWEESLAAVQAKCNQNPWVSAEYIFTPNWPFSNANFQGPTSNTVSCIGDLLR